MQRDGGPRRADKLIWALIVPSIFCVVADRQMWPFSQYMMFSKLTAPTAQLRLYAVDASGNERLLTRSELAPLDYFQTPIALDGAVDKGQRAVLDATMKNVLERTQKRAAEHHTVAPAGVRMYADRWAIDIDREERVAPTEHVLMAALEIAPAAEPMVMR